MFPPRSYSEKSRKLRRLTILVAARTIYQMAERNKGGKAETSPNGTTSIAIPLSEELNPSFSVAAQWSS